MLCFKPVYSVKNSFSAYFRFCLLASLLFFTLIEPVYAEQLTVGVYQNKPLVFQDAHGKFQGLTIDILQYIAQKEGWNLKIVSGTWNECLQRLARGETDIQVAIAVSDERKKFLNYNKQTLITNWGRVYRNPGIDAESLLDLDGKTVALLEKDIHARVFSNLMEKFNKHVTIISLGSYDQVLEQIDAGSVDVGVVNRLYAMQNSDRFKVKATPIIFNPIEVRYAAPRGKNNHFLQAIDRHLSELKDDKNSIYYQSLEKWFGHYQPTGLPEWIWPVLLAGGTLLFLIIIISFLLNKKVVAKTSELQTELLDRKKVEKSLRESQETLLTVLESIDATVYVVDLESYEILFMNKKMRNLFGGDFQGKVCYKNLRQSDIPCSQCLNDKLLDNHGKPTDVHTWEDYNPVADKWFINNDRAIKWVNGKYVRLQIAFDISDRKKAEEEKFRAADQLLKIQKLESVGVLAGGIAHDFNNIMSAIIGNIEMASFQIADKDTTASSLLKEAQKAVKRATKLTNQLLTFSKGGDPVRDSTSLPELITESADFVLHGSKVACRYHFPDDLWMVTVDSGQISQVIQNIIINAKHAMPDGGAITIHCTNIRNNSGEVLLGTHDKKYVRITIKDTGLGVAKENLDKIFDPYFSTKEEGNGLGLAICNSIISKHQGSITVDSVRDKGTTFTLYLPAVTSTVHNIPDTAELVEKLPSARIMIMDDDKMVRDTVTLQLKALEHEPISVSDGEQAIRLYKELKERRTPVDIVIMDLTIPGGMGGRQAARQLLQIDPQVTLIVASGYSNDPVMANYSKYGFSAAVSKPIDLDGLSKAIKTALQR